MRSTIQRLGRTTKRWASLRLTICKLQTPVLGDDFGHLRPLVASVGKDTFDERKGSPRRAQQVARAVAILHVGRVDGDAQQEAKRIDEDVPLAAGDLLARIEALRVERRAPF